MSVDCISLLILSLVFCYFFFRQISQIKTIKTEQILVITSLIGMGVVIVSESLLLSDYINLLIFEKILKSVLGLIFAIFLTLVSLVSFVSARASDKKMRTLWRIPIIGFLAGLYFELPYVLYICAGNVALSIMICQKNIKELRYLRVKVIPLIVSIAIFLMANLGNLAFVNTGLLSCVLFGAPLLNLANIHGLIRSKGKLS